VYSIGEHLNFLSYFTDIGLQSERRTCLQPARYNRLRH